jgi:hypothetical protein
MIGINGKFLFGIALSAVLFAPAFVRGDLIHISADTNALDAWHGTLQTSGSVVLPLPVGTKYLNVDVEYAVYEPGTFNNSFPGCDPSNGNEYVYAYQLFNRTSSTDTGILKFTLGVSNEAFPIGSYITEIENPAATSIRVSAPATVGTTAINWTYAPSTSRIRTGENSKLLLFTSHDAPTWNFANLVGYSGATTPANNYFLPSPVPEPGTLIALAIAGFLFCLRRAIRRN